MKFTLSTLFGIFFIPFLIKAQQQQPVKMHLSLEGAIELALTNNPKLLAKGLDIQITKEVTAQAKWKRIPQVYTDFNLQRNLIIPVTPVPANAFNPNAPEGEILPLRFATKWTANTGINAQIDLFNPQRKQAVKEAEIKEEISGLQKEKEENDLYFDVSIAYAMALVASVQVKLSEADTLTKARILKMSQQQFDLGRLTLIELNQVKRDRNTTLGNFEETEKIFSNSKAQLLYYLGYEPVAEVEIEFSDSIESLFLLHQKDILIDSTQSFALKSLLQNDLLINTQINGAKSGYLPLLSMKAYYGANYFDKNFELFKSSNWNGNSFLNVGVRIPITEGLDRQKKINQLKLQKDANALAYKDQQHKNKLDFLEASRDADFYQKKYRLTMANFKIAEKNLQLTEQQYENGRLLISDLYRSSYNYQQEKTNYLNVAYNFIIAKMKRYKISRY
ncbi:outer membrane protein [Pedobacter sp. CG_S7]|uniref:TolC family protein n=1 Tax=Pedobacter sp. CG_S7 TaxID=3143930 RepID=UPI00339091A8